MPYVPEDSRQRMRDGGLPKTVGDLNYLISLELRQRYINKPRYEMIEENMAEFFENPENSAFLSVLSRGLPFGREQINRAARLAYLEFYDRVGRNHEDRAAAKNGDLYFDILQVVPKPKK